jgi:hypothetical protein
MLQFPEDVRNFLARKYHNQRQDWLGGGGSWPLEITLGHPKESDAGAHTDAVRDWVSAWSSWSGPGDLSWAKRHWRILGTQRLPSKLALRSPLDVATWVGEERLWDRARGRYDLLIRRWPALAGHLVRYFDALVDYSDYDMRVLEALLAWLVEHPASNLYPRQIPLPGMDTKWLEPRMTLVSGLLDCLQGSDSVPRCGLKPLPHVVRLRVLDSALRPCVGHLADISAPVGDLAALPLPVSRVYIVENLQTGLSFEDRPGAIVFVGLGRGACALAQVPWVASAECIYWGDIDTHGLAILSSLRAVLPRIVSVLMDEATLLRYRDLWVEEPDQYSPRSLPLLTTSEQAVYEGLKQQRWGRNVRLEQERIAWNHAWEVLCDSNN